MLVASASANKGGLATTVRPPCAPTQVFLNNKKKKEKRKKIEDEDKRKKYTEKTKNNRKETKERKDIKNLICCSSQSVGEWG